MLNCVGRVAQAEMNDEIYGGLQTLGNVIRYNVERLNQLVGGTGENK